MIHNIQKVPIEKYEIDLYPVEEFMEASMLFGHMINVLRAIAVKWPSINEWGGGMIGS